MKHLLRVMLLAILLLIIATVSAQDDISGTPTEICEAATPADEPASRTYIEPEVVIEPDVDYRAIFCTDAGAVYIDLLEDYTPSTVNNFIFLAQRDYYNNTIFHRVLENFMAQAGDPTATGSGGPGYQFRDEPVGFLTFDRPGLLAMANAGPGTNGSQFFITTAPSLHLNYRHTIFGDVLEGQDNVENIILRDPSVADAPATVLQTVVIITDPEAVTSDYENTLETATAEDFITGLNFVGSEGQLPPPLLNGFEAAHVVDVADIPELFVENGHEFRVPVTIVNDQCSDEYFFETLIYTVDAFASEADVATFLNSEDFATWNTDAGFTAIETDINVTLYQSQADSGCTEATTLSRVYMQRGRYLVTLDVILPQTLLEQATNDAVADLLHNTLPQIFEVSLTDAYRAELP